MSIKSCKIGVLWVCVILSIVCVTVLRAEPECKAVQQTKPAANSAEQIAAYEAVVASYNTQEAAKETPYADAQIMVEAFVVEVTTEGLKALGVSPLGQTPDGISIAKLTDCLMQGDNAKVISGAKVTAKQGELGTAKEEKVIYHKYTRKNFAGGTEMMDVSFVDFKLNKLLNTKARIESCNLVSLEYNYQENGVQFDNDDDPNYPSPPTQYTYNWTGQLSLQHGKPKIVAAVQNKDNVVFLVLTATIQTDTPTPAAEEKKEKSK
jgi:hypothetical protein